MLKFPDKPLDEFRYSIGKMGKSGALFDILKLNDVAKSVMSGLSENEMYEFLKSWADEYGTETEKGFFANKEYMLKVLALCMGVGGKKRRKAADDSAAWFAKVKEIASQNEFAADMKAYKENPSAFKGNVSDVAEMLRVAVTGLANTPDLWTIMQILGGERVAKRLDAAIQAL